MRYIVTLNGKDYEVDVDELDTATVNSVRDSVAPTAASVQPAPAEAVAKPEGSGTPVKAPMPGTVLSIKAEAGQKVNEGDVIILLEAMKMENEITAPVSGTVSKIAVSKGANVATDDILAFID